MGYYLIYHPKRQQTKIGDLIVHHDNFGGNEDPYIWNKKFLHSYCHITQLHNEIGQINFWVSGNTSLNNFTQLYCDCVFKIAAKHYWNNSNNISIHDPLVDNAQTFEHHYKWAYNHEFKKRRRYTLKAEPKESFQPQDGKGTLLDILPFLNKNGIATHFLIESLKAGVGSRPYKLEDSLGIKLYNYLLAKSRVKLFGNDLIKKHPFRNKIFQSKSIYCS